MTDLQALSPVAMGALALLVALGDSLQASCA